MTTIAELDEIIDRAFMDAYDIDEQSIGLATVVTDGIEPPFVASVIGVEVEVVDTVVREAGMLEEPAVVCKRDDKRYVIDVLDLEDWQDAPGAEYIAAYRKFCKLPPWGEGDDASSTDMTTEDGGEAEEPRRRYPRIERQLGLDDAEGSLSFATLVDVFVAKSWDGHFYSSFLIDSKNFRHVPAETQNWFDLLALFLDEAVVIAHRRPKEGLAHLERLLRLYSEGLPSDRVVFADELGEWMIPTDFRAIVDRYVELIPEVHSGSDMLVAFDPVSHMLSIPERVDFFLEHGFRDEAAMTARRARGRRITEVLNVLKAHGETELADELADKHSNE